MNTHVISGMVRRACRRLVLPLLLALSVGGNRLALAQATNGGYTIGVFRASPNQDGSAAVWWVDIYGTHTWQPPYPASLPYWFGLGGDIPVMGDWSFTGLRRMGVFRPQGKTGVWYVDTDNSYSWTSGDSVFFFGFPTDLPLTLPWTDGYLHLAVYRPSESALYIDPTQCNCPTYELRFPIYNTQVGDLPVMISIDGQGGRLAFYRPSNGNWYIGPLGASGNYSFDLSSAVVYQYGGLPGDLPVAGDWSGTGSSNWNLGIFRGGWVVDADGDHVWQSYDPVFSFGLAGDKPVMGPWSNSSPATLLQPTPGSTLTGSSVQFSWSSGTNVSQYQLTVKVDGTTICSYTGTALSYTCNGIPTNGHSVSVSLASLIAGVWQTAIQYGFYAAPPQQYYLTTAVSPAQGGTISPASGWYNSGVVVQVSASAASGYVFSGFSGNLGGTTTPQYLTMNGPESVTANFIQPLPTISTLSLPSGPPQVGFTITGANFGPAPAPCPYPSSPNGCVMLTGLPGGSIPLTVINNSWTTSTIQVQLPANTPTPPVGQTYPGNIYVVTAAGTVSNQVSFTVSATFGCNF